MSLLTSTLFAEAKYRLFDVYKQLLKQERLPFEWNSTPNPKSLPKTINIEVHEVVIIILLVNIMVCGYMVQRTNLANTCSHHVLFAFYKKYFLVAALSLIYRY